MSGEKTIELPVVFNEDEATQLADKQLKVAWAEAEGEFTFTLPAEYDYLVVGDVFGIYLRGNIQRMRIDKIERADYTIKLTTKVDRQSAYTSNVKGLPLPDPTPPPPTIAGPTIFEYLNIPALLDSNDILGYYYAGSGQNRAWTGATIQRKHESIDEDYVRIDTIEGLKRVAKLLDNVNDASEHYADTTNIIHVQMYDKEAAFESVSQEVLLRENNAIAIPTGNGFAEIIQFKTAENLGGGIFKLSYLLRGRLNTVTSNHVAGSNVVFLNDARMIVADASEIGTTFLHRAVSYGEQVEDAEEHVSPFQTPMMQVEFPVDLLAGYRTLNQVNLTWSPRERFGSDVNPVRSVNWNGYEVVITDGSTTETYKTNDPQLNQITGFNSSVTATVYQLNRFTGRGPGVSINIA